MPGSLLELLGHAHDAVFVHDAQAFVVDANEEACRTLGYSREELVGMHVRDLVEGLDPSALERMIEVLKHQGSASFRAVHRRKDGTRFPVETRVALIRSDGPVRVVAFARDRTAQEEAARALRQSEERYRSLVELLPDAVIACRGDRISFANRAAARMFGAAGPAALVGTPVLDRVLPGSRHLARERLARLAAGAAIPLSEEVLVRTDGTTLQAEGAAVPLGSGEVLVVLRDVTERERARAERSALEERLRQAEKIEALGRLAGGVAHDFNNVLAAILGHADALASELPPGSPACDDAEQIAAAARRAKGVVQQILAFARRRPAEIGPVDVARIVTDELALVRAATPSNVEIVLRADPGAGAVRADPTQIHQVLLNLCANARDALAARGGVVEIEIAAAEVPGRGAPAGLPPGPYVRLSVCDGGEGMDAQTRARAFEPYFTTKPPGAGSGLGLPVVHGIATGLGGGVALESEPEAGTRVHVWLPRVSGPVAAPAVRPPAGPPGHHRRVLLVDDDPPVARAIGRMLELSGYAVDVAADAETALERFRAAPASFDLVLTDQTLPGMRGDELTVALLAVRPDVPIVICTGYSERLDDERARALGARALLAKPLDVRELSRALSEALGAA
jgi:PAS domain S-box-containing protein